MGLQSLMQGAECFFMWDSDEDACHLLSHETFYQMSMLKSGFWEDESGSDGRPGVEVEALRRQVSWCDITAQWGSLQDDPISERLNFCAAGHRDSQIRLCKTSCQIAEISLTWVDFGVGSQPRQRQRRKIWVHYSPVNKHSADVQFGQYRC